MTVWAVTYTCSKILHVHVTYVAFICMFFFCGGGGLLWSYGSWIYNYLCHQWLSPLKLWVRIPLRRGVLDTTLCDKVCRLSDLRQLVHAFLQVLWFPPPIKLTATIYRFNVTEILLKVVLNTIILTL